MEPMKKVTFFHWLLKSKWLNKESVILALYKVIDFLFYDYTLYKII